MPTATTLKQSELARTIKRGRKFRANAGSFGRGAVGKTAGTRAARVAATRAAGLSPVAIAGLVGAGAIGSASQRANRSIESRGQDTSARQDRILKLVKKLRGSGKSTKGRVGRATTIRK